jgi:hypothetical protein
MRILVIGFPLPNKDMENYSVLTGPSYFDYDGLFIDPASITGSVRSLLEGEREFEAFDGRPVLNAPGTASNASAADQVRRRLDETQRLLEAGGTVMVMARPNLTQQGLLGFEGCDRYSWLPAPAGLSWGPPALVTAEGRTVRIVDETHPVAGFLRRFRPQVAYRAVFDERQAAVRQGRVLATGGAGVPIAMEFQVLGGRVLFLPALTDDTGPIRAEIAEAIVDLFAELAGRELEQEAPWWARSQPLPGLEQAEAELEELELAARASREKADAARERHDQLASHRRLLWAEGRPFQAAVEAGLRVLGFELSSAGDGGLAISSEGVTALVEAESSRDDVVEWPYVRLQRRLEARLLAGEAGTRGLVVANGKRLTDPAERGPGFTETLALACENYRFALVSGPDLFALVQRALAGADDAALLGVRRRLLTGAGRVAVDAALGEAPESSDAGPIF